MAHKVLFLKGKKKRMKKAFLKEKSAQDGFSNT